VSQRGESLQPDTTAGNTPRSTCPRLAIACLSRVRSHSTCWTRDPKSSEHRQGRGGGLAGGQLSPLASTVGSVRRCGGSEAVRLSLASASVVSLLMRRPWPAPAVASTSASGAWAQMSLCCPPRLSSDLGALAEGLRLSEGASPDLRDGMDSDWRETVASPESLEAATGCCARFSFAIVSSSRSYLE
jgi:hypothetical protein